MYYKQKLMNTKKKWETLISIIVWLVIIWIIISSIIAIFNSNYSIQWAYTKDSKMKLLKDSTANIVRNLDLSWLNVWDEFYLYKDTTNMKYLIFTWTTNAKYKYVNENWELLTDTWVNSSKYMFARSILIQKEDSLLWNKNKILKIIITDLTSQ